MEARNYLVFVVTCRTGFANHKPHPRVTHTIFRFTRTHGTLGTGRSSECPRIDNRVHPCHTLSERNELSIVAILEDT
jgi:hypothetical protein